MAPQSLLSTLAAPLIGMFRRKVRPTQAGGVSGVQVYGGFVTSQERDPELIGPRRYQTFDEIMLNRAIVGAALRYTLQLIAATEWKVDTEGTKGTKRKRGELVESCLDDMTTPWRRVTRKGALYKYLGFSLQEWIAKKRDDGAIGFADVEARPQFTAWQWDMDDTGTVFGVVQRSPRDGTLNYLPREKLVYLVDDTITDHPEGIGLLRHCVRPAKVLERYEQLEGFGFDTDLRGIPIARVPLLELQRLVKADVMKQEDAARIVAGMTSFVENRVKTPSLGLVLDSAVYTTKDGPATPSPQKLYDLDVVNHAGTSQKDVHTAIDRLNHEIARILGVEELMLGGGGARGGSQALAKNKSQQLSVIIDGTVKDLRDAYQRDLIKVLCELNGFAEEDVPELKASSVKLRDVEEMTQALLNLAQAGQPLAPDDPVGDDIREILQLSARPELTDMYDALLRSDRQVVEVSSRQVSEARAATPKPGAPGGSPTASVQDGTKDPEPSDAVDPGRAAAGSKDNAAAKPKAKGGRK